MERMDANMTETERIAKLTADAKKGDSAAFGSLYTAYGKRIYYFCLALVGDSDIALDVTEDTFVYARRNIRQLPAEQTFYHWICGNAFYFAKIALASLRGGSANIEPVEDPDTSAFEQMLADNKLPTPEPTIRRADLEAVTKLVGKLPDSDRLCVMLYDYASFSPEEVASVAGCSVATAKCRIYYANEALIAGMEETAPGFGELLRPHLGRLLRTCGRNCNPPAELNQRVAAALQAVEEELPAAYESAPEEKPVTISKKATSLLYILLALMLVCGLVYVIYWFSTSPGEESSDPASRTESTLSLPGESSEEESLTEESSEVEEPSRPEESSEDEEPSQPEESSGPEESSESEESADDTPAELPRTTTRLRMRKSPDTTDNSNIIATIPENTHVEILDSATDENGDLWYFVRYDVASGMWHEGYCFAEYIETESEE